MNSNKIRINMLTSWDIKCGIGHYSKFLVNELIKNQNLKINVIPVKNLYSANPLYFFKLVRIAKNDADIVHLQGHSFGKLWKINFTPFVYLMLAFQKKIKIVTTIHEISGVKGSRSIKTLLGMVYGKIIYHFPIKYSDLLIVHTKESKELLKKGEEKIVIIPHGSYQKPILLDEDECKKKLGLKEKKILTIFGYVDEHKGYKNILKILPELDKDTLLLIAGGPRLKSHMRYFEELKQVEESNKQIKVTGYIEEENIPIMLNASDIILFPYTNVTQSGPLHLALSYRKPVITSDLPAFREIKEKYDCICIARNEEEFLKKIKELLENRVKKEHLVKNTRKYWEVTNWEVIAKKHFEIYRDLYMQK